MKILDLLREARNKKIRKLVDNEINDVLDRLMEDIDFEIKEMKNYDTFSEDFKKGFYEGLGTAKFRIRLQYVGDRYWEC